MNFDNLVEEICAFPHSDECFALSEEDIKSLILTYIERDRAQSGEPVAYRYNRKMGIGGIDCIYTEAPPEHNPTLTSQCVSVDPLFTHAQPTPEQIAESVITKLVKAQEPLDAESAKVLYDNLWDLYES